MYNLKTGSTLNKYNNKFLKSSYKTICVIGLGSVGSFLCKHLSYNENIKKLILIDPQTVQKHNLQNSFFTENDIGKPKVECLQNSIDKSHSKIQIFQHKYEEGKTKLPNCDLVVDCRDFICSRKKEINVKFYIDERSLVIDCRKFVKRISHYGSYFMKLKKSEIREAAFIAYKLISTPSILNKMINNEVLQSLNIDETISNIFQDIRLKNSNDLVYESYKGLERIHSFQDYIETTVKESQKTEIDVFVGEEHIWKKFSFVSLTSSPEYSVIPKGSDYKTVLKVIADLISKQKGDLEYSMSLSSKGGKISVLLIRETGAA